MIRARPRRPLLRLSASRRCFFDDPVDPAPVLRDSGDDYLLALARSAKAEVIVTGDKDLLDHTGLQPPAISAREAVGRLAPPP